MPSARAPKVLAGGALICCLGASLAAAQTLYKFRDADGSWVYSDRKPAGTLDYEAVVRDADPVASGVTIAQRRNPAGEAMLVAINDFHAWVQMAFQIEAGRNLDAGVPTMGNLLLPPRGETELIVLRPADAASVSAAAYRYQFIHGHPGAKHSPEQPYRLPYALANAYEVTQAYPDNITHTGAANRHAVDFAMPIGTGVNAARAGIVIETAAEFFSAGLDAVQDGARANIVRILHDDGTLALYGHLNWDSIRVVPGQRVARGEYIADSGNTGFSSGPHLHFVVQRNSAGMVESVPVQFAGAGSAAFTPLTGDRPVAY